MRTPQLAEKPLQLTICCLVAMVALGCHFGTERGYIDHKEQVVPVQGVVLFEGKPCKNAFIIFHRTTKPSAEETGGRADAPPINPRGECNDLGEYQLYTYASDDGAPPGDYLIAVSWKDPEGTGREENFPELLPNRYQNPQTSGLKAKIDDSPTIIPTIRLTR